MKPLGSAHLPTLSAADDPSLGPFRVPDYQVTLTRHSHVAEALNQGDLQVKAENKGYNSERL